MAAANIPQEEFDDEFLTCCVCQSLYNDPRVLPCLHTFCARCLERWRKGERQFTCPTCRQQVSLQGTGVNSIPVSFHINRLLDFRALRRSEESHACCQMCESGARVEGTCGDCRLLLCKNCITSHGNIPTLKDHYIITLDDLKNPRSRQNYTRAQYCPKHTDQRMTFFCQPCAKLVCRDCTITEHRPGPDHDPQDVSKAAQEVRAELQTLLQKAQETTEDLKKTTSAVGKELTTIATNCDIEDRKIQEHFSKLRGKLDEAEKEMRGKLREMEKTQREPLLKEREVLEKLKVHRDGLHSCANVLARDGNWVSTISSDGDKLNRPHGVAVTEDGHVFVADAGDHYIRKYRYM
ncbi:E3 ubiquitin-protein ligase TRIM56-like [Branchiostoma floridae]|uniref:RING-type E3 ubiquitin transferase n=1 Tax=Branchiostoma floridae TaxID=7739 RepID=A0A9J7HV33_BRAFL|nr:E3 ubiquitin-protein ligase TRIM56-like [Branchiostoma floridae]